MVEPHTTAETDGDDLRRAVEDVEDPELPYVTIGDLGMVRGVAIRADGTATIRLTPTYTGCPATEQISDDVAAAVRSAGFEPDVQMVMSPAWSTDWITPRGHERLRAAGITPPPPATSPDQAVPVAAPVACPRCDSRRTRLITEFGATACKASYVCNACSEPFEAFKAL
jgi:ring-1,2-phenylacetyl-CoA epoxidase subunit PaaD